MMRRGGVMPLLCALLWVADARADKVDKKECAQAHEDSQRSTRAGKLRKARDELNICSRDECIAPVRKDCIMWLEEVTAGIPSIVVEARGPDGRETLDVKLSIGEEVIASKLDVRAIELDPGTYSLRFEREGSASIEKAVVLRQGQKNKIVEVSFAVPKEAGRDATPTTPAGRPVSVFPWVLGGVGIALAGAGAFFWVSAESTRGDLVSANCSPNCDASAVDDIKTQRLVGDVLGIAGVVAIGSALVWLLTEQSSPRARPNGVVKQTGASQRGFAF